MRSSLFTGSGWLSIFVFITFIVCSEGGSDSSSTIGNIHDNEAIMVKIALEGSLQNPAWSPDGNQLVFTRFRKGYNRGPADLMIFNLKTDSIKTVISDGSDNINLPGSAWNPNTGLIIFSSTRPPHDEIFVIGENEGVGSEIKITDRPGLAAFEPSLSPDGRWVVFESHRVDVEDNGIITKYKIDGSNSYQSLTGDNDDSRQPNWSPCGSLIVYQAFASAQWDIWIMNTDGTNQRKVTSGPGSKTDASFSPDGKWIIYSSDESTLEFANLFVIPVSGGDPVRVTHHVDGYDGAPSWSPNAGKIVFESTKGEPEKSAGTKIWMINVPNL